MGDINLTALTGTVPILPLGQRSEGTHALSPGTNENSNYPTTCQKYIKGCQNAPIRVLKRISPSSSDLWKTIILWVCNLIYGKTNINQDQVRQIADNKQVIRSPQVESINLSNIIGNMPFNTDDVRDAITIAAIKSKPPVPTEAPRHVLIEGQSIPDRIPVEDQTKVRNFIGKLKASGMFSFEDGVIKTKSGLQAAVTYNTETHKICIYYYGTKFSLRGRGKQTMLADLQIATGGVHKMFCEAVILANCAASEFGSDKTLLTGHSLGGSLCQFASASLMIPGISLNPAAINENLLLGLPTDRLTYAKNNGLQISVQGDIVSDRIFTGSNQSRCIQLFGNKVVFPYNGQGNPHMQSALKTAFSTMVPSQIAQNQRA
ncbi:MAG: hypothetical protein LBC11_00935 [Puniceicoccales bacterium]|jgi:hypothetical protein|nr:hypothetical protein [Puniceicoccales bacterium]